MVQSILCRQPASYLKRNDEPMSKEDKAKQVVRDMRRRELCPPDMTQERWAKHLENSDRAMELTGVMPITSDGWEKVAVMLMDHIEQLKGV